MRLRVFISIFSIFIFGAFLTSADVPKLLHYQGNLTDSQGIALGEARKLTFRLYDAEIQGNLLWKQDFNEVEIVNGNFAVLLDVSTASPALTFNQPYWLSIEVDDDGEMTPRQQIASSAYSINTQTVNGIPASTTAQANNLLPLNAQGKFPQSVLDIQQGSGGNFNADTVDGFHASSIPTANTLLPLDSSAKVSLNAIPQDQGSGLNADKVDGNEASDFYNLDNERFSGTLLASHVEHDGLNADKVDGVDSTQINADKVDGYDASDLFFFNNIQVFTSDGTWTKPTGVSRVYVKVWGGGGGGGTGSGGDGGSGGGGGGYSEGYVTVTGNVTVTVGSGGAIAGNGGNSFFAGSTTITANGGSGGRTRASGGAGGSASNGQINFTGMSGQNSSAPVTSIGGTGGGSPFGGAGGDGGIGANPSVEGMVGGIPGGGGGGAAGGGAPAGVGAKGLVIVYY